MVCERCEPRDRLDGIVKEDLNLNDRCNIRAKVSLTGHKKNCVIELEEIERISSLHRVEKADLIAYLLNTPSIISLLHRQP